MIFDSLLQDFQRSSCRLPHPWVPHCLSTIWFDFDFDALSLSTSSSSFSLYLPIFRVSLKKLFSMILVKESASCAPECTHRSVIPSESCSLIARVCNCVLNSWQLGGAVRVTRSYKLLQSVAATESGCDCCKRYVAVATALGSCSSVSAGCFQPSVGLYNQPQYNRRSTDKLI